MVTPPLPSEAPTSAPSACSGRHVELTNSALGGLRGVESRVDSADVYYDQRAMNRC